MRNFAKELHQINSLEKYLLDMKYGLYTDFGDTIKEWLLENKNKNNPFIIKFDDEYILFKDAEINVWNANSKILPTYRIYGLVVTPRFDTIDRAFRCSTTFNFESKFEIVEYEEFIKILEEKKHKIFENTEENYDFQYKYSAFYRFYEDGPYAKYNSYFNDEYIQNFLNEMFKREDEEYEND